MNINNSIQVLSLKDYKKLILAIGSVLIFSGLSCFAVAQSTLSVSLQASPSSGVAPLKNVSLTATVSGTAQGSISYKFDCQNDGSWDYIFYNVENTSKSVSSACNFSAPGTYYAKVYVERGSAVPASATAKITVTGSSASCSGNTCSSCSSSCTLPPSTPSCPKPTLYVTLEAIPNSGYAPLNDVDLKATVSGTAQGSISYKFDCQNDGSWDYTFNSITDNPKTVYDACDFTNPGTYTAKVYVERGGLGPISATAQINVFYYYYSQPTPTVDLRINGSDGPITIDYNNSATLSWTSINVNSCYASDGWSGSAKMRLISAPFIAKLLGKKKQNFFTPRSASAKMPLDSVSSK